MDRWTDGATTLHSVVECYMYMWLYNNAGEVIVKCSACICTQLHEV